MTVALSVSHNLPAINAILKRRARQVPYAVAVALNKTALDAQRFQQAHIRRIFNVRAQRWMSRQVKHKPRAKKTQKPAPWTRLAIDPPGGRQKSGVVGKFETGGRKVARHRHIAIPSEAKRSGQGRIRANQRIASFHFRRIGGTIKGEKRSWIIEHGPSAGIYQRFGARRKKRAKRGTAHRSKGRYRQLYSFARSVPIHSRLQFIANIKRIVRKQFPGRFSNAWREAMRTAR